MSVCTRNRTLSEQHLNFVLKICCFKITNRKTVSGVYESRWQCHVQYQSRYSIAVLDSPCYPLNTFDPYFHQNPQQRTFFLQSIPTLSVMNAFLSHNVGHILCLYSIFFVVNDIIIIIIDIYYFFYFLIVASLIPCLYFFSPLTQGRFINGHWCVDSTRK